MTAAPAVTPVMTPVFETVAIPGALLVQLPPDIVDRYVVVEPIQIFGVPPLRTPGLGVADTVTVLSTNTAAQPPVADMVYLMVAIPAATPVITPDALTVAKVGCWDVQIPPETVGINVVVSPTQIA